MQNDIINLVKESKERILKEKNERNEEKRKNGEHKYFSPSSLGRCSRAIVYDMLYIPGKDKDYTFAAICDNGTSFHNRFEGYLKDAGILIANEASFKINGFCSGRTDAIVKNTREHTPSADIITLYTEEHELDEDGRWKKDEEGKFVMYNKQVYEGPNNDVILIELKSVGSKKFEKLVNATKPTNIQHVLQLMFYMKALNIVHGALIYENKDTQKLKQFNLDYDPELGQMAWEQCEFCTRCVEAKKLPPKLASDADCTFCDYCDICKPEYAPEAEAKRKRFGF